MYWKVYNIIAALQIQGNQVACASTIGYFFDWVRYFSKRKSWTCHCSAIVVTKEHVPVGPVGDGSESWLGGHVIYDM